MFNLAGLPDDVIDQILDEVVQLRRYEVWNAARIIQTFWILRWIRAGQKRALANLEEVRRAHREWDFRAMDEWANANDWFAGCRM